MKCTSGSRSRQWSTLILTSVVLVACSSGGGGPVYIATPPEVSTVVQTVMVTATPWVYAGEWPGEGSPGPPVSEWRGVPVMPGAIAGTEEGPHGIFYLYVTEASLEQVVNYYLDELPERGWEVEIIDDTYIVFEIEDNGFSVSFPNIPNTDLTSVELAALY